ncbi:hypothetical protein POX_a00617 [Penicillium oxalicum]|uniref:hypothetical protein n=1 Tax=Penicillium oxalicum TaxID=69781 RepID=UPI0020B8796B|nr:hypothetical protein POX_a00617 [Penicillium oxalicum]KAI2794027.1 hypothetical protein POX_a00617 [Penicillium oxalicum]
MMHPMLFLLVALAFVAWPGAEAKNTLTYCATANTGSDFSSVTSIYQSNGACQTTCAGYALGVLQGNRCWCTNVAPSESSQTDVSDCATGCPGYPADSCGSASEGVYAYVAVVGNSVTSTAGGGGDKTSSTSSSSKSTSTTSSTSSTTTDPASTTGSVVMVETTLAGLVKTITVPAPSGTGTQDSSSNSGGSGTGNLSGGSIAGIVIGVLGGLALVGALIFMVFFYRKRARAASPIPSTADMTEHRASQASSFSRGVFPQGAQDLSGSSLGRKHTFTDNRLKTDIYPNGPRDSSVSLQDNEDYSRPVLRLTNPD